MKLNQELLAQEEIQVLGHQETNHNRELLAQEEMITQELNQVREEIPNQEWKHQEVTRSREWKLQEAEILNQEWKLQEEIRNREETAKVQEEEEDKLRADLTVGFFVFYNYYLIQ